MDKCRKINFGYIITLACIIICMALFWFKVQGVSREIGEVRVEMSSLKTDVIKSLDENTLAINRISDLIHQMREDLNK